MRFIRQGHLLTFSFVLALGSKVKSPRTDVFEASQPSLSSAYGTGVPGDARHITSPQGVSFYVIESARFCVLRHGETRPWPFATIQSQNSASVSIPHRIADNTAVGPCNSSFGQRKVPVETLSMQRPRKRKKVPLRHTTARISTITCNDKELNAIELPGFMHIVGYTEAFYHQFDYVYNYVAAQEFFSTNTSTAGARGGVLFDKPFFRLRAQQQSGARELSLGVAKLFGHEARGETEIFEVVENAIRAGTAAQASAHRWRWMKKEAPLSRKAEGGVQIDAICPATALVWPKIFKRTAVTARVVREAIYRAFHVNGGHTKVDANADSNLDVVVLNRPVGKGGWSNVPELLWGVRDLLKRKRAQFRSVRLEEFDDSMPFREQLAVIARTQIFIGAHGAGLTHLNYLPAGACVVEIWPECTYDDAYRNWAKWRGDLHYYGLLNSSVADPDATIAHAANDSGPVLGNMERLQSDRREVCHWPRASSQAEVIRRFTSCRKGRTNCWKRFRAAHQTVKVSEVQRALSNCLQAREDGEPSSSTAVLWRNV